MDKNKYFKIGYVAKTHGLKGGFTSVLDTDFDVAELIDLFLEVNGSIVPYQVESISDRGDKTFVKLKDVNSPEEAAKLKGSSIYLSKELRPKLKKGDFYDDEIIAFEVIDTNLGSIGFVKELVQTGLNKLIVVTNSSGKEILIPVNAPFILSVLKTKKKLHVDLPSGFLEF